MSLLATVFEQNQTNIRLLWPEHHWQSDCRSARHSKRVTVIRAQPVKTNLKTNKKKLQKEFQLRSSIYNSWTQSTRGHHYGLPVVKDAIISSRKGGKYPTHVLPS